MLDLQPISVEEFNSLKSRNANNCAMSRVRGHKTHRGPATEKRSLLHKPICAIDGEGNTISDCSHRYCMLLASWDTGRLKMVPEDGKELTPDDCIQFIQSLPRGHVYVIYGGSYDFNMMLKHLPWELQNRLLDTGTVLYKSWCIDWLERKYFRVSNWIDNKRQGMRTVFDVLPNFQMKFVAPPDSNELGALESWDIGTPEGRAIIRMMKDKRSNFAHIDPAEIERYCFLECDYLRALCRKFFDAVLETGYRPKAVYGPGAIAVAALEKHGVKKHIAKLDCELDSITKLAYFGGRFDCAAFGWFFDE